MRTLQLDLFVEFPNGNYTVLNMLREFVFSQDWSQDEASAACFERVTNAIRNKVPCEIEEKDFQTLCARLKQVQIPPQVSIELGYLRNEFVLKTPKDDS